MITAIKTLTISVLAVFAPIQAMLIAAFVLSGIDLITGLVVAVRQKQPITSSGLKRTVGKIFLYELAIMMSYVSETYLMGAIMPVTKIVAGFIGATELKSVLENLDLINGSSLFTTLVTKLSSNEKDKLEK